MLALGGAQLNACSLALWRRRLSCLRRRWLCLWRRLLGFYFTRDVLLDQQLQSRDETRARSRRAARVMALSVWQSSALVLFFGIMSSRLMAGPGRAEIEIPDTEVVPLCDDAAFRIFPWALLVWMVNVFFFSVIFERIIQRRED